MKRRTNKINTMLLILCILFVVISGACSGNEVTQPQHGPEQNSDSYIENFQDFIVISGTGEDKLSVDLEEIKGLEAFTRDVVLKNSSGEEKNHVVTGTLLEHVLEQQGIMKDDIISIRLIAGDGYSVEVPEEVIKQRDMLLVYFIDGQELDDESKPVRMVIPEERAMYWVKNLVEIEIVKQTEHQVTNQEEVSNINRIIILDEVKNIVELQQYEEGDDSAFKASDIIEAFSKEEESNSVFFKAIDDFEKNETLAIFESAFIKITGSNSPVFTGPDLPKGMQVKDILYFIHGKTAYLSMETAIEFFDTAVLSDNKGILISDIAGQINLYGAQTYIFSSYDGYQVEISGNELENGIIYMDGNGQARTFFENLPRNTGIKGLLTIEVIE